MLSLTDRIKGALLGSAIGAELSFAALVRPEMINIDKPEDIFHLTLSPADDYHEELGRVGARRLTPFISLGVRSYLAQNGRVVPEDFAAQLRDDVDISGPVFGWDGIHTVQELLREGMLPRISGMGAAPCGLIAAAMPAVGIYHFADAEYAYLDGVELASVAQGRMGADWAALCAAAIAAAFINGQTAETLVESILKLAHNNCRELFYKINRTTLIANGITDDNAFADWWYNQAGRGGTNHEMSWVAPNPMSFVLPLLTRYANDAEKFMALLFAPPFADGFDSMSGRRAVPAIIGGAIIGAMGGSEAFPEKWRSWGEPIAQSWYPLQQVVEKRLATEREIIVISEQAAEPRQNKLSLLHDKIYGNILAGAIGNAMGSPVEGKMYWEIDEIYPDGIHTVLEPKRLESEDDNQMAMLLTETYLDRDGLPVMARHFGHSWREKLNRDHFFPLCMGHAYDLICQGWDPRITGHWSVVTGSTVMCLEPIGIYHCADPEYAAIDATAVAYMYQRGLDNIAATMLAATTSEALKSDADVSSILQAALNAAPKGALKTFDRRPFSSAYEYIARCLDIADKYDDVLAVRKELYDECLCYHMIDPLELWGFALAIFKVANGDVRQSAIGGTNIGRDSDTIAGRAAMLAGTLRGAGNVPAEWVAMFREESLQKISRNAARFCELINNKKLPRLRLRQEGNGGE